MKKQNQQKQEVEMKTTKFCFWNQGKSYTMIVTAPEDVPYYRLKEIFDNNFVGKGSSISFDPNVFSRYEGSYTVS